MPRDLSRLMDEIFGTLKSVADRLNARMDVIERREPSPARDGLPGVPGAPGAPGRDGKDADPTVIAKLQDEIAVLRSQIVGTKAPDPVDITPAIQERVEAEVSALSKQMQSELASMVSDRLAVAVANLPVPENGKDGRSVTPEDVAPLVAAEVQKVVAAIPIPQNGQDGRSVTADDVAPLIAAEVKAAVSALPAPKDGEKGADGKDVDPAVVEDMVADWVTRAVAALPPPRNGQDGTSVTVEDVAPLVAQEVQKAVSALPVPKDGHNGKDGAGVVGAVIDREGSLVLTFSDGTTKTLGVVVGRDGAKGDPGADGFGFEDLEEELEDEGRVLVRRYRSGDRVKEFRHKTAFVIDRGVYQPGRTYEKGDGTTWGGSYWIAQESASAKPGESKAWRLTVKKGTDGRVGPEGKPGPIGPKGDKGDRGPDRF